MEKLIFIITLLTVSCIPFSAQSQNQGEEKEYEIGARNVSLIEPNQVTYQYKSNLFENEVFQVEYNSENKTFKIFKNEQEVSVDDAVFAELAVSPYEFNLEEYYNHLGTNAPPLKCQFLSFGVIEHEFIVAGSYQMCQDEPLRLRLRELIEDDETQLVYDSSISKKIHRSGFWEEVWADETPNKK